MLSRLGFRGGFGSLAELGLHGEQLRDCDKFESATEQPIKRGRHRADSGCVKIVSEDDAALVGVAQDAGGNNRRAWAFPVHGVDRPKNRGVAVFVVGDGALALAESAVGWAHGFHFVASGVFDGIAAAIEFPTQLIVAKLSEESVCLRVVADFVSFGDRLAEHAGVAVHALADDIEGCLDVSLAKHAEEARCILRMRAVIEGHGDVFV